jgi:pyridoxamine 5'-phosphate oxidase
MSDSDLRDTLRALRVFDVDLPEFDPNAAPAIPDQLFAAWLAHAIDAGVREPKGCRTGRAAVGGAQLLLAGGRPTGPDPWPSD